MALWEGDRAQTWMSFGEAGPTPISSLSDQTEPQRGANTREVRGISEQRVWTLYTGTAPGGEKLREETGYMGCLGR